MALPQLGKPAPSFQGKAVFSDRIFDISLDDYVNRYLVLLFYPANFSCVCPTELIAFSDHAREFEEINASIVACSTESHESHLKWLSTPRKDGGIRGLRIPLIADRSMAITKKYGVLSEDDGMPYRAMFIIDAEGILRQITITDRLVGRNTAEAYRLVQACQNANKSCETAHKENVLESTIPSIRTLTMFQYAEKGTRHDLVE